MITVINNKQVEVKRTRDRFGRITDCDTFNNGTEKVKVGMYCNESGYSDVRPYEVVGVNESGKTITIREMDSKLVDSWKPEMVEGGFAGHCTNNHDQNYEYSSIENGYTMKVRLSTKGWGKGKFHISYIPIRFYDYNF